MVKGHFFFPIFLLGSKVESHGISLRKRHFWHPWRNGLTRSLQDLWLRIGNFQSLDPSGDKWGAASQTPEHSSPLWCRPPGLDSALPSCKKSAVDILSKSLISLAQTQHSVVNRLSRWDFEIFWCFWWSLLNYKLVNCSLGRISRELWLLNNGQV